MDNQSQTLEKKLAEYLQMFYRPEEYPALRYLQAKWRSTQPFAGKKVLVATPVFRNTMTEYQTLLAGGAEVVVSVGDLMPCDPKIVALLKEMGFRVLETLPDPTETFDLVLDCAGCHCDVKSRFGYVELTRSGIYRYTDTQKPLFFADASRIKELETCLGTGDGFLRAMQQLGYDDFAGKKAVLFGYGKVGRGIGFYLLRNGVSLTVIDDPANLKTELASGIKALVDYHDADAVNAALDGVWAVITATGHANAVAPHCDTAKLIASESLLVNMGVEDEFGAAIPGKRVLNHKQPLNFILEEPTRLCYLETTMALHAAGGEFLLQRAADAQQKLYTSPVELEMELLTPTIQHGIAGTEIRELWNL